MREECKQGHVINSSGKCPCDTELQTRYPISDWRYEVENGDTLLGYEEWLEHQVEANG